MANSHPVKMGVQEAAKLLSVSEKTIYRWLKAGNLPAYRIQDQYRFNRAELLAWAISRRINVPDSIFEDSLRVTGNVPTLAGAVTRGGIHYRVQAGTKEEALRCVVELTRVDEPVNRDGILRSLLAREALAPTAVGGGIAIPQLLYPNTLEIAEPIVSLLFLEAAVDYDGFDGLPVKALLGLLCSSLRAYHILLNRLYYSLRDPLLLEAIRREDGRNQIAEHFVRIEHNLRKSHPSELPV